MTISPQSRVEVAPVLKSKLEALLDESRRVHQMLEQVIFRIDYQGADAALDGFDASRWSALMTEVRALQETLAANE